MKPLYKIMTLGQVPQLFYLLPISSGWESHFTLGTVWWFSVYWKCNINVINLRVGNLSCSMYGHSHVQFFYAGLCLHWKRICVSQTGGEGLLKGTAQCWASESCKHLLYHSVGVRAVSFWACAQGKKAHRVSALLRDCFFHFREDPLYVFS